MALIDYLRLKHRSRVDRILGRFDYKRAKATTFYPFGGPMNGATARLEVVRWIIQHCGIEQIIETGTFRGTTTEWFSQFGLPALSAEISERFVAFSKRRLKRRGKVTVALGSSVELLDRWLSQPEIAGKRTLFYLDAHWLEHLPLREEIDIIAKRCNSWVIVIDDFKAPHDDGYGYDDYGPGKALDLDYVRRSSLEPIIAFFPSVPSRWETGRKRGYVILASDEDLAGEIAEQPLVRRYHPSPTAT